MRESFIGEAAYIGERHQPACTLMAARRIVARDAEPDMIVKAIR